MTSIVNYCERLDDDAKQFALITTTFTAAWLFLWAFGVIEMKVVLGALSLALVQRLPCL